MLAHATWAKAFCLILLIALDLDAQTVRRRRSSTGGLRRKVHVADLITTPGTVEAEWYHTLSPSGNYWIPSLLKMTPSAGDGFWGQTELSIGFDAIDSEIGDNGRVTHSTDHITLNSTHVLWSEKHFSFALGPQITFSTRGQQPVHAGGSVISRWDFGLNNQNNLGLTAQWVNPGILDIGGGAGRQLSQTGFGKFVTPHVSVTWEKVNGSSGFMSVNEGVAFQVTKKLALDIGAQHVGAPDAHMDHQFQIGLIGNFGKIRR